LFSSAGYIVYKTRSVLDPDQVNNARLPSELVSLTFNFQ